MRNTNRTTVPRKYRRVLIGSGITLAVLAVTYFGFFSLLSPRHHLRAARKSGVVGALARFHLRYLRPHEDLEQNNTRDPLLHQALYSVFDPVASKAQNQADLAVARLLIECGHNVDAVDHEGKTMLMGAVRDYNNEKVLALIELGADPNAPGTKEFSAQTAATMFAEQVKRDLEAFPLVLGCDPEFIRPSKYWQIMLLRFAARTTGLDFHRCQPPSATEIKRAVEIHGPALRRPAVARALGLKN